MKKLIYVFCAVFFISCGNATNPSTEIKPLAIPSDTVLFKYVLGDSKAKVETHTNELLKSKKIQELITRELTMSYAGHRTNFTEKGYPCIIYIGEDSISALMSFKFYNDTLLTQRFYLFNNSPSYTELTNLYGKSQSKNETISWNIGDKAIHRTDYSGHYTLSFEKISLKKRMEIEKRNVKADESTNLKKSNKEKSKNMGW